MVRMKTASCWDVMALQPNFHFISFHVLYIHIVTCVTLDLSNYILRNYSV